MQLDIINAKMFFFIISMLIPNNNAGINATKTYTFLEN